MWRIHFEVVSTDDKCSRLGEVDTTKEYDNSNNRTMTIKGLLCAKYVLSLFQA